MRMNIAVLVYARYESQVRKKVEFICDNWFGKGKDEWLSNYYDIQEVRPADSKRGGELIEQGMSYTKSEFNDSLDSIRATLSANSNEEVFEKNPNNIFFRFACCGGRVKEFVYLLGNDGQLIKNPLDLAEAMKKRGFESLEVFVASVMMRF